MSYQKRKLKFSGVKVTKEEVIAYIRNKYPGCLIEGVDEILRCTEHKEVGVVSKEECVECNACGRWDN
jgi:hypothetical protein